MELANKAGGNIRHSGFSLIEMMIALGIFAGVAAAVISSYQSQQYSYIKQEKMSEAQQNIRAALFFLERDIRRMGYDPSEQASASSSLSIIARKAELRLVWDSDEDGLIETDEIIRYGLTSDGNNAVNDSARDGRANGFPCNLARAEGSDELKDSNSVADNVEALEFFYHFADGTTATDCLTQAQRENIRSVDISILVRSRETIRTYVDSNTYQAASGATWGPFLDNHLRRLMISNIKCRNMGIDG